MSPFLSRPVALVGSAPSRSWSFESGGLLRQRVQAAGIRTDVFAESSPHHFAVLALARVSPSAHFHGPLTLWNAEERQLWEALRRPVDAYSLQVDAVAPIVQSVPAVN
eukprot:3029654-Alexandrium_andersonii.AAC.1